MQPGFRKEAARRPADSALRRYLLRSKEAALRQSSRKQNSGYWRQISRPTSSLSRCFSFSPIVRTQGAISAGVSEAVLPPEAEIEATAINFPRLRPAGPPARRPTHTAAHRRTVRWVRTPKAPPQAPAARAQPWARGRSHDVPEVVTPRNTPGVPPLLPPSQSCVPGFRAGSSSTSDPPSSEIRGKLQHSVTACIAEERERGLCPSTRETTASQLPVPACGIPRALGAA